MERDTVISVATSEVFSIIEAKLTAILTGSHNADLIHIDREFIRSLVSKYDKESQDKILSAVASKILHRGILENRRC